MRIHLPEHDTSGQDQGTPGNQRGTFWLIVVVGLGGLLTVVWIALLLWVAFEAIRSAFR